MVISATHRQLYRQKGGRHHNGHQDEYGHHHLVRLDVRCAIITRKLRNFAIAIHTSCSHQLD
eukprot:scaffold6649_cov147-Skeletonema_dohrnii-CCMP3373.AAC.6